MRSHRGQATVEYVAALALLVCILAGAAVAVAAPGVPRAVVGKLRTALCIVGGDVCTSDDAAARGLEPCVVGSHQRDETGGASLLFVRVGATDGFVVERRSDGTILLHSAGGSEVSATTGIGFKLGSVQVGGDASAGLSFRSGNTWRVTEAQLRGIARRTQGDPSDVSRLGLEKLLGPPTDRYREGGASASVKASLAKLKGIPSAGADARQVLGRRTSADGTTYYFDIGAVPTGTIAKAIPGLPAGAHIGAEYRASDPPVLRLRTEGESHDEATEQVLTLPLRTPGDRAAARRLLIPTLPTAALAVHDLVGRIADHGTIEQRRYRVKRDQDGWGGEVALGAKLGADHHVTTLDRTLVEALVRTGDTTNRREDCVPSP